MNPRRSEQDVAGARERLIAGTRELLWERGYAAASPRAIMERAGVGQGSMYHHFAGKEELAAAAFAEAAAATSQSAERALAGPGPAPERIRNYLLRQREVLRGCPVGRMAQDPEVLASDPLSRVLQDTFSRLREQVRSVVDEGRAAGEFPAALDAAELADTVLAVVQGGYVLARAQGRATPFNRAVKGAAALIDLACRPAAATTDSHSHPELSDGPAPGAARPATATTPTRSRHENR